MVAEQPPLFADQGNIELGFCPKPAASHGNLLACEVTKQDRGGRRLSGPPQMMNEKPGSLPDCATNTCRQAAL
jgi:hypothetical protein